MECCWCHRQIDGWYYKYKHRVFCDINDGQCLKEYLFEKFEDDIEFDRVYTEDEYDMSHVDDDLDFGEGEEE